MPKKIKFNGPHRVYSFYLGQDHEYALKAYSERCGIRSLSAALRNLIERAEPHFFSDNPRIKHKRGNYLKDFER